MDYNLDDSGGASSGNSPGPGKVLKMFARSYTKVKFEKLILLVYLGSTTQRGGEIPNVTTSSNYVVSEKGRPKVPAPGPIFSVTGHRTCQDLV